MRLSSQRCRAARRPRLSSTSLATLAAIAPSLSRAFNITAAPPANLDFSQLGSIGIAGDFNGISLYQFQEQIARPLSTNGSEYLLTQLPNGVLAPIAATDASILAMCSVTLQDGAEGVLLGGNFTSMDGIKSTAMAIYNTNTTTFTPLDGLEGEVNALLCDDDKGIVYVGGNLKGGNSTNAIAWKVDGNWTNLPFAGFNAPVSSIAKASNGHIIFGGSFTGLGNVTAPNKADGQAINLSTAEISADGTASTKGFDDPKNVICTDGSGGSGKTWLLKDGVPGSWGATFDFGFEPTKLRLWNTHQDGRGTKTFRFVALPINGIMNFTYIDPATGKNSSCTSECPLSNDPKVQFQDFHFVNRVGMDAFQIDISAWYGKGAGLNGVQLFEDNMFSYAINSFNEPACNITFPSSASATGPWKQSPSLQSDSKYLTAQLSSPISSKSASVVFSPNIIESGNYSVNMYTPGCVPDGSCLTRGRVNITGIMSSGNIPSNFTTSIYQTNNFDKYDQIYFGYIERTSDSFKPKVTLTPLDGQDLSEMTFVAQKVGFTLLNSTGNLNGLFDFDPSQNKVNTTSLDDSPVNQLGASFDHNTGVKSLATAGDVTYIGGNFTSDAHHNFVAIDTSGKIISLNGGLNGQVLDMYLQDTQLFVGGDFTNLRSSGKGGLNHVAVYDTKSQEWSALGAGVNGRVEQVVAFQVNISSVTEDAIALTGSFTECNAFGSFEATPAHGFAVWVLSRDNWLQNLDDPAPSFGGMLTASKLNLTTGNSLFAGSIESSQLGANGAVMLSDQGLGRFPVQIQPKAQQTGSKRRRDLSPEPTSGVLAGAFYTGNSSNITVLAGHFSARSSNGSTIENLVIIDDSNNGTVSGLGSGISSESVFTSLVFHGSVLFAGGNVTGTIDGSSISGLIAYDVVSKSYSSQQPASLLGGNQTLSVVTVRPDSSEIYAGGSFEKAGALDCPGVCTYDADSAQWSRPGSTLAGRVSSFMWFSKTQLIAGGDLRTNGTDTGYLAMYDVKKRVWKDFAGASQIPGPVNAITPGSNDNGQLWISGNSPNGSIFIMKYDGKQWQSPSVLPPSGSVVQSLQVFTVTESHNKSDLLDDRQVLMLTGSIPFPNVGMASAAIYNGTDYLPYALTSTDTGAGSIARVFSQKDNFFTSSGKHLPLVFVVLIGLAISLALIVILVVSGIILDRIRKKREGYTPAPTSMYDRGSGIQRVPPRELLEQLERTRPGEAPQV
ncbi:cellular morphogenesis protein, putative [Trichoderma parareesei]|uniref:Cellular morphogenesis protein, putative n=1 Tax=Trichoderma parareesei TaxID=858221 RepID=A0A2H2ZJI6_TRIPA|nr:cellular morphogenesis protein, putative [Trichoderma parareesei]